MALETTRYELVLGLVVGHLVKMTGWTIWLVAILFAFGELSLPHSPSSVSKMPASRLVHGKWGWSLVQWCSVDEESGLRMDNRVSCCCFDIAAFREGNELVVLDLRLQNARFSDVLFISCVVSVFTFIHPPCDNWELRKPLTETFEHSNSIKNTSSGSIISTPNEAFNVSTYAFSIRTD